MQIKITVDTAKDGTYIYVNRGSTREHFLVALFTPETDDDAISVFIALCKEHRERLLVVCREYEKCVKQNMLSAPADRRSFAIFAERERFINALCKEAGIIDT